jgi:hypothetical protein
MISASTVLQSDLARRNAVCLPQVRRLDESDQAQVISLLSLDPLHGLYLHSLIADNGLCHPANQGRFFGYFEKNELMGVALLGQQILIHTRPEAGEEALFHFARTTADLRIRSQRMIGPREQVENFFSHFSGQECETRLISNQLCYVSEHAAPAPPLQLCQASLNELEAIARINAGIVLEARGVDPGRIDPEGYRRRITERIRRGRIWVKRKDHEIVFKAEVVLETDTAAYLEGIWTHPEWRNRGVAKACLAELMHRLLRERQVLSLLVEPSREAARRLYEQVGFVYFEDYQARFLSPPA